MGKNILRRARSYSLLTLTTAACFMALTPVSRAENQTDVLNLFSMDENVWATFYDLPSRRFRAIRDAFIGKEFDTATRDLQVSIGFLSVEAARADPTLYKPLNENIERLEYLRLNIREQSVSVGDLDSAFARAHWLLAQHYLVLAMHSRDKQQHKNAGQYLWATAHHLERAVLWSDARVDRSIVAALDSTREMGSQLQRSVKPEDVYRDKPIASTAKTLARIGEHLNRKVWVTAN